MDNIPENVINKKLYNDAKRTVYPRYKRPSAYRSMALQKEYIRLGGKYKKKTKGLATWRREKWVSVADYLKGKNIACGDDDIGNNVCRPTKRINASTPITIQEVIKKHGRDKVEKIIKRKIKNMKLRIDWNDLTIS